MASVCACVFASACACVFASACVCVAIVLLSPSLCQRERKADKKKQKKRKETDLPSDIMKMQQ